jgi:hypothetical protein
VVGRRGWRIGNPFVPVLKVKVMKVEKANYHEGGCMECHVGTPVFKFDIGMFKARLCSVCWKKLKLEFEARLKEKK